MKQNKSKKSQPKSNPALAPSAKAPNHASNYHTISNREHLAQYPQLASLIAMLLEPAIETGLNPEQAEAIYNQLLQHYSKLTGHVFWPLREELVRILHMADKDFPEAL